MSASELVGRLHNINFHPYGRLETTGIQQLRDVFMAPNRLAERGVIARETLNIPVSSNSALRLSGLPLLPHYPESLDRLLRDLGAVG